MIERRLLASTAHCSQQPHSTDGGSSLLSPRDQQSHFRSPGCLSLPTIHTVCATGSLKKEKKKDSMFLLAKMHLFSLFLSLRRAVLEIVQCCAAKPTGVAQSVPTRRGQDGPSACTADGARLTGVRVWGKYTRSKVNPSCRTTVRLRTPYLTGPCPPSD